MPLQINTSITEPSPLWQFVDLPGYQVPKFSGTEAVYRGWASIKKFLERQRTDAQAPLKSAKDLKSLSEVRLKHLVKPVDWQIPATALNEHLSRKQAEALQPSVTFIIKPPHGCLDEILAAWMKLSHAQTIPSPTQKEIFDQDLNWFSTWPGQGQAWFLPDLEHCYFRHPRGFLMVRRLLEMVVHGESAPGLIACDSWAWNFLERIYPLSSSRVLTLQAFDGERLARLFAHQSPHSVKQILHFLNVKTGKLILSTDEQEKADFSPELHQLAAHCRGNVGLALYYWRKRLRDEPDEQETTEAETKGAGTKTKAERAVWVAEMPSEPVLPSEKEEDTAILMHALLLHNGLSMDVLVEILPLSRPRLSSLLARLRDLGIVELWKNLWRVTATAYLFVRDFLRVRGYLIDNI
jgi:hypothetical protein